MARDAEVQEQLTAEGWRSLVVWECELRDPSAVQNRVREFTMRSLEIFAGCGACARRSMF